MHTPGFNADASLCRTGSHYRMVGMSALTSSPAVRPALFPPPSCIRACEFAHGCELTRCLCECEGGVYSPIPHPGFPCGTCRYDRAGHG
jgi:hypothetical protein